MKGLAVYTPNTIRRFDCKLDKIEGVDYRKGKLKILYIAKTGKTEKLAEAEISLK